eukprot:2858205-Rhodomonas_salina.1
MTSSTDSTTEKSRIVTVSIAPPDMPSSAAPDGVTADATVAGPVRVCATANVIVPTVVSPARRSMLAVVAHDGASGIWNSTTAAAAFSCSGFSPSSRAAVSSRTAVEYAPLREVDAVS